MVEVTLSVIEKKMAEKRKKAAERNRETSEMMEAVMVRTKLLAGDRGLVTE